METVISLSDDFDKEMLDIWKDIFDDEDMNLGSQFRQNCRNSCSHKVCGNRLLSKIQQPGWEPSFQVPAIKLLWFW